VKRAYYSLYAGLRTEEILSENRKILEDFRAIARERLATRGTQQDVLKSEVLISELDRELANNQPDCPSRVDVALTRGQESQRHPSAGDGGRQHAGRLVERVNWHRLTSYVRGAIMVLARGG
jgi:hypothetical protein